MNASGCGGGFRTMSRVLTFPSFLQHGSWANNNTVADAPTAGDASEDATADGPGADGRGVGLVGLACGNNVSQPNSYYLPEEALFRHSFGVSALYCLAYTAVFIVGLFGNSFVVAVVYRAPRMRTVTNFFIVNLAMADILVLVFCLPATLLGNLFVRKFLAICYPLKCQITGRRARIILVFIWIVALLIPLPWAMYFELLPLSDEYPDLVVCVELWPNQDSDKLYFLLGNLLSFYVMPLAVISFCYLQIWLTVSNRSIPGENKQEHMDAMMAKSKMKVVKMLVVVVVVFMLSWMPLYTIITLMKFDPSLDEGRPTSAVITFMIPVAQWLGSSNSSINPVLYAFFNNKFRRGFVAIIRSKQCCGMLKYDLKPKTSTFRSKSDFYSYRSSWRDTQTELLSGTTGV
uniref:G-protein coupled receptors family 1 profile domain-containing protein n=1 Tax=Strigamia maritima TaxID=126957 RepID=T1JEB6_STRMM